MSEVRACFSGPRSGLEDTSMDEGLGEDTAGPEAPPMLSTEEALSEMSQSAASSLVEETNLEHDSWFHVEHDQSRALGAMPFLGDSETDSNGRPLPGVSRQPDGSVTYNAADDPLLTNDRTDVISEASGDGSDDGSSDSGSDDSDSDGWSGVSAPFCQMEFPEVDDDDEDWSGGVNAEAAAGALSTQCTRSRLGSRQGCAANVPPTSGALRLGAAKRRKRKRVQDNNFH